MNKEFLDSLEKPQTDYTKIFDKLYRGVIETNKLIGIGLDDLTAQSRQDLIKTYGKLREEEIKEVLEAIDAKDRDNLIKELLDVLIVTGYEYYLKEDYAFTAHNEDFYSETVDMSLKSCLRHLGRKRTHVIDILTATQEALVYMNIDLEAAIDAVLAENLSKFPTQVGLSVPYLDNTKEAFIDITPAGMVKWQCSQLESERYQGVHCKEVVDSEGRTRLTFWCTHEYGKEKLKYLKPISYKKCDLSGVWLH